MMLRFDQQEERLDNIEKKLSTPPSRDSTSTSDQGIYDKSELKDNYLTHFSQSLPKSSTRKVVCNKHRFCKLKQLHVKR